MNARRQIRVRMGAAVKTREAGQHASVPLHTPEIPVRTVKRMHLFEKSSIYTRLFNEKIKLHKEVNIQPIESRVRG